MKNKNKFGFTLAELMAVVIIVAILMSLGVGYYKRAVEQSRFSEGLMMASALAEAVNRHYIEQTMAGVAAKDITYDIATLDIGGWKTCPKEYSSTRDVDVKKLRCSKYFAFDIISDDTNKGTVLAIRMRGRIQETYQIKINPHFGTNRDQISCVYYTGHASRVSEDTARPFCESMGYTKCNNGECTKPL